MPASAQNAGFGLQVLNTDNQQATVYVGVAATLAVTLTNNVGVDIPLTFGANASVLQIYMPEFYTVGDLGNMKISLADWNFSVNAANECLVLTYAGTAAGTWANGANLAFSITNVLTSNAPDVNPLQINPGNMGANVPSQVQLPLTLANPPIHGHPKLDTTLQVSVDSQGSVYVSSEHDPLQNTLFLNLKNMGDGPLYAGTAPWKGKPTVVVSFVYGSNPGALAPDNDKSAPQVGSAWNIQSSIQTSEGNAWSVMQPANAHPQWLLQPATTNVGIIGTGQSANITFQFSQIVSLTDIGHTQMIVLFTGFMKDENTPYDDHVFVLDIIKQKPPPTRGILNFFSPKPITLVNDPTQPVAIDLHWSMLYVPKINLISSFPGSVPYTKPYTSGAALQYDSYTVNIPGVSQNTPIFLTLQALDGNGVYLNSQQFTVFIQSEVFVDPRDGKIYPTIQVGTQVWMAQNLDYNAGTNCCYYNDDGTNEVPYGRLYNWDGANQNLPPNWRLPTEADWKALISSFTSPEAAYSALIAGGSKNFNAQLGGWGTNVGSGFIEKQSDGYYWTASETDPTDAFFIEFASEKSTIFLGSDFPLACALSVRYVRNL